MQYEGLKYADDDTDARWLAKLLRLGLLAKGYIYPTDQALLPTQVFAHPSRGGHQEGGPQAGAGLLLHPARSGGL